MKNNILILISLLFLTGCLEEKEEREVSYLQDRNGIKYEVNTYAGFTGKYVEYDDHGQKQFEEHLKLGKRHGLYLEWYEDGQKKKETNYKNGKQEGLKTFWNNNGQRKWEGNFKNGKKEGLFIGWYANGQKRFEGNAKYGKDDGLWTYWDEEGNLVKTKTYKDGDLVK